MKHSPEITQGRKGECAESSEWLSIIGWIFKRVSLYSFLHVFFKISSLGHIICIIHTYFSSPKWLTWRDTFYVVVPDVNLISRHPERMLKLDLPWLLLEWSFRSL